MELWSTLGRARAAEVAVNLERALELGQRLGGHMVSGHVDGRGELMGLESRGEGWLLRVAAPEEILAQSVAKGSIAVDGISLTLASVDGSEFSAAIIPETFRRTTLGLKKPGEVLNLESDLIGKYVFRAMEAHGEGAACGRSERRPPASVFDLLARK